LRQKECVTLKWSEVNTKQIVRIGKGDKRVVFPIADSIREILFPLQGQHPEFVFTYVAVYGNKRLGIVRGQRYRLTLSGTKSRWQRMRAKAGVKDFRFHDYRHDFGTKLLRDCGNLKLVQKAMNHTDIKSTLRYAHVNDKEIAAAVERAQSPGKSPGAELGGIAASSLALTHKALENEGFCIFVCHQPRARKPNKTVQKTGFGGKESQTKSQTDMCGS
jgi:site-specific recombinase XerC